MNLMFHSRLIRWTSLAGLLILALVSENCGHSVGLMGDHQTPYHRLLRKMYREKKFYGIERVPYLTTVVYRSESLRRAYVEEYAKRYQLSQDEYQTMLSEELAIEQKFDEFIVFHFSSDSRASRVEIDDSGVWRIRLERDKDKNRVSPDTITHLAGERPILEYFYPHLTPWSKNYVVRFPKMVAQSLTLHMVSIDATLKFDWRQ